MRETAESLAKEERSARWRGKGSVRFRRARWFVLGALATTAVLPLLMVWLVFQPRGSALVGTSWLVGPIMMALCGYTAWKGGRYRVWMGKTIRGMLEMDLVLVILAGGLSMATPLMWGNGWEPGPILVARGLAALLCGGTAVAIWRFMEEVRLREKAEWGLVCGECGYDLCGSPERCPECGTMTVRP